MTTTAEREKVDTPGIEPGTARSHIIVLSGRDKPTTPCAHTPKIRVCTSIRQPAQHGIQTNADLRPPCPRSPLMYCERFWSMSIKLAWPLFAKSAKFAALARRMSFIAIYLEMHLSFRLLLDRPTLPNGFARSIFPVTAPD
jgi:hypothetical protein